jgi:hypothetical protein
MAKDYKYEDSTPVDEPVRKRKIKAQEPGSGIRVDSKPIKASRKFHGLDDDPDEYGSVRQEGFSKDLSRLKDKALDRTKDAAISIAKGAAKSAVLPGVGPVMAGEDFSKGARELEMGQRLRDTAKSMKGSADREMANEVKRESRGKKDDSLRGKFSELTGMKKGGMTASSRADGCATKGKTKGRFV